MNQDKVLIGSDPEVFLFDDGRIVSAIGRVPGSKDRPHKTEHGWVQPDNMLAEVNIHPAATEDEFLSGIRGALYDLLEFGQYSVKASHVFEDEELIASGPEAFQFGCDPDFNAWKDGLRNPRPDARAVGGLRTAGGHIHIGCALAQQRPLDVIRGMDVLLGLQSVILDTDNRRRKIYGKAGAFRPKSYGVEYRTLSNFWLTTDELVRWAYRRTHAVLDNIEYLTEFSHRNSDEIQYAINTSNVQAAEHLLKECAVA